MDPLHAQAKLSRTTTGRYLGLANILSSKSGHLYAERPAPVDQIRVPRCIIYRKAHAGRPPGLDVITSRKAGVSAHCVAGYLRLVWSVPLNIGHAYTVSELLLLLTLLTRTLRASLRHALELLQK